MIKKIVTVLIFFVAAVSFGQEGNASPYSYYGVGLHNFKGTIENQSMGGLTTQGDSIHLNLGNPAGYGALKLTNFALAVSHTQSQLKSEAGNGETSSTTFDYLALGFPLSSKMGAGFGLVPYTSTDYKIAEETDDEYTMFTGRGGINRAFISAGYEIFKGVRVGASANYNFGNIRYEAVRDDNDVEHGIRELNRSDLMGFTYELGLQVEQPLYKNVKIYGAASFTPEATLNSENERDLETVIVSRTENAVLGVQDHTDIDRPDSDFTMPMAYDASLGLGEKNKWFAGVAYGYQDAKNATEAIYAGDNVSYQEAIAYRAGGYFIPRFNSISSYWQRVTYRAGFRYEDLGLKVNNVGISEFGISFGLGLPLPRTFSNANLMFEYGKRGTVNAGLIEEDFFKVGLSLSLNAKWFEPFKFN